MNLITKTINSMSGKFRARDIFRDYVEMSAIAISNAVDKPQYEKREAHFLQIEKKYDPSERKEIANMLGMLVMDMEANPRDVLGEVFNELEMGNDRTGQFFTPYEISVMMAKITFDDKLNDIIEERGFITVQEPAVGAGGMIIAAADELTHKGINYQQSMHVTAIDIDPICVHMSYLQFSLLHIPAIVVHGDTLRMEEWSHWYTPAHIMGGWQRKINSATYKDDRQPVANSALQVAKQALELVQDVTIQEPKQVPKVDAKLDQPKTVFGEQLRLF